MKVMGQTGSGRQWRGFLGQGEGAPFSKEGMRKKRHLEETTGHFRRKSEGVCSF